MESCGMLKKLSKHGIFDNKFYSRLGNDIEVLF